MMEGTIEPMSADEWTKPGKFVERTHLRFFTKRSALETVQAAFTGRNVKQKWSFKAHVVDALTLAVFSDFLTAEAQATPKPQTPLHA
jgi:hypothetical protein